MDSELKVLKAIWENKGQTHVKSISKRVGLSQDYVRYICNFLDKKGQISRPIRKLDWCGLTAKGKKALKLYGIVKSETSKKARDIENIIRYLPQKTVTKSSRSGSVVADEKKLNLGRSIAKTISFLKKSEKICQQKRERKQF